MIALIASGRASGAERILDAERRRTFRAGAGIPERNKSIEELFEEGTEIDAALERAARKALIRHKKLGQSIVVWEDGKVVVLPPDKIPV